MNHAGRKENFANGMSTGHSRSEATGKSETLENFKAQSPAVPRTEISTGPSVSERKQEGKKNCENKVEDSVNCKVQNASPGAAVNSITTAVADEVKVCTDVPTCIQLTVAPDLYSLLSVCDQRDFL